MPRPSFPPTPAPSTDISGKRKASAGHFDASFALPPAAISGGRGSTTDASSATSNASDSSYRPLSPASPVATTKPTPASRKRSSPGQTLITKDDYSLPPPPTRSRKIIQMKPKESKEQPQTTTPIATAKPTPAAGNGGKKKQSGGNSAAGRKIARKTAHSLIERRRRSKMNEEFGVLKDMIPACAGQEMHKLAILQASIEYMQYLQQCVDNLKVAHRSKRPSPTPTSPQRQRPPPAPRDLPEEEEEEDDDDEVEDDVEDDEDEEMSDAVSPTHTYDAKLKSAYRFANASPAIYPSDRSLHSITTSPALDPGNARHYSATISPALQPSDPHHYSLASSVRSTATSPLIQASSAGTAQMPSQSQFHNPFPTAPSSKNSVSEPAGGSFALTSPALGPQADREDQEATEALLMLNTDRRTWNDGGRGMSVKDLLSG